MTENFGFLMGDTSRLMRKRFDERARGIGATRAQWQTLTKLSRHEGINQGGLADLLEVEPITLCRMIDRLEESGLVERRRDPADRRVWRIYLTDKSRPLLGQLQAIAGEMIEGALAGIAPGERARLMTLLETVHSNLNSQPESIEAAHG